MFVREVMTHDPDATAELLVADVVAYPDLTLWELAYPMAETEITRLAVVAREDPDTTLGVVTLTDALQARRVDLHEERVSERVLDPRQLVSRRRVRTFS
jgi:CBS domain containing-hemolysin-like protein